MSSLPIPDSSLLSNMLFANIFSQPLACLFTLFFLNLLIYLFLASLGLRCCARAFSSCGERGLLFVAVRGLLIVVASLIAEHGLQERRLQQLWCTGFSSCGSWALERRLSSCGARAQLLRGMWDLPTPGLEPVSPALAGGILTTAPPGKSSLYTLNSIFHGANVLSFNKVLFFLS